MLGRASVVGSQLSGFRFDDFFFVIAWSEAMTQSMQPSVVSNRFDDRFFVIARSEMTTQSMRLSLQSIARS